MAKTILYAGSNKEVSASISGCIERRGYVVDYFADPKKAISALKDHTYGLGIIDMDGDGKTSRCDELLEKLKEDPDFPVITMSYQSQTDQHLKKAEEYLNKPINLNELVEKIEKHMNPQK
jgi:DNA-binding NtrC family response regulator